MAATKTVLTEKAPEAELLRKDGSYLSCLVEDMLEEMGVTNYDSRTTHLLVDILQRESLGLLKDAQEQSENRISKEKMRLLQDSGKHGSTLPKLSVRVSEEDAQLACQQYISRGVARSSFLQDIKEMQRYANSVRLGVKTISLPPSKQSRGFLAALRSSEAGNMGFFPTGAPPHLPENIALNTLMPTWDVTVKKEK
ncbi:uncharacterized protein BXIN_1380 [Babesia sp. Xinjiang]|uniref:uncharacterized protein n=1 Tax=Babesia sp. Xinjiang TaxID=462227 RepID=UPI000A238B47|nr:uncharacterized protein BXIN_1380 [Babesia sp. Xinjiang]ORM39949.1 hypothetical protein BXIN_1380 [Babesia sp. Xinjiang]